MTKHCEAQLNRLVRYLSRFEAGRTIDRKHHISRELIREHFAHPYIKIKDTDIVKLCQKISKKPYTYFAVKEKFGNRGLHALAIGYTAKRRIETLTLYKTMCDYKKANPLVTVHDMAKIFKVSPTLVTVAWNWMGIKEKMPKASVVRGDRNREEVFRLYQSGITSRSELSQVTGLKTNTVTALLNDKGIRCKGKYTDEDIRKIHHLRTVTKLKWKDIAYIFNTSVGRIHGMYLSRKDFVREVEHV